MPCWNDGGIEKLDMHIWNSLYLLLFTVSGEICAFKIHGQDTPFKAEVLNKTSGEGVLKASGPIDCEQQKEFTFIIQAYDCGADISGDSWKKSHKCVDVIWNLNVSSPLNLQEIKCALLYTLHI